MASTSKYRRFIGGDRSLWIVILILSIFSILVIYSSTASMAYRKLDGDTSHFLIRQVRFVLMGLMVIYIFHQINYQVYFKNAKTIFRVAVILMLLTFVTGETYNDATRWLSIPMTGFTFQPADLLKIALIIRMAVQLASSQKIIDRIPILPSFSIGDWQRHPQKNNHILYKTTMPLLMPVALSCILVMVSNLSTAIIIGLTCVIILIIGRVRWSEIVRLLFFIMTLFLLVVGIMKLFNVGRVDTWISRVENFFDRDEKKNTEVSEDSGQFQMHQAKIAVASGWIMGKGPGHSTQRSNLPHPYSDYAYAFIVEEYGIIGALFVLGCYLWIFYRAIIIFRKCETAFPSILVLGMSLMITLQAILHIAVSLDLTPVTGQTLPIISLGGSSLLFTCASLGIILSVSRQQNLVEHRKMIEEKRRLVLNEWQHVKIADEETEETEKEKKKSGGYSNYEIHGVKWNNSDEHANE